MELPDTEGTVMRSLLLLLIALSLLLTACGQPQAPGPPTTEPTLHFAVGVASSADESPITYFEAQLEGGSTTGPTTFEVEGPEGWNGNEVWGSTSSTATAYTVGYWAHPAPVSGTYTAHLTVGGRTYEASATLDATKVIEPVTDITVGFTEADIVVNWTPVAGAVGYGAWLESDDGTTFLYEWVTEPEASFSLSGAASQASASSDLTVQADRAYRVTVDAYDHVADKPSGQVNISRAASEPFFLPAPPYDLEDQLVLRFVDAAGVEQVNASVSGYWVSHAEARWTLSFFDQTGRDGAVVAFDHGRWAEAPRGPSKLFFAVQFAGSRAPLVMLMDDVDSSGLIEVNVDDAALVPVDLRITHGGQPTDGQLALGHLHGDQVLMLSYIEPSSGRVLVSEGGYSVELLVEELGYVLWEDVTVASHFVLPVELTDQPVHTLEIEVSSGGGAPLESNFVSWTRELEDARLRKLSPVRPVDSPLHFSPGDYWLSGTVGLGQGPDYWNYTFEGLFDMSTAGGTTTASMGGELTATLEVVDITPEGDGYVVGLTGGVFDAEHHRLSSVASITDAFAWIYPTLTVTAPGGAEVNLVENAAQFLGHSDQITFYVEELGSYTAVLEWEVGPYPSDPPRAEVEFVVGE